MNAVIDIEPLINELALCGLDISYDYLEENIQMQVIDIDAENLDKVWNPFFYLQYYLFPGIASVHSITLNFPESSQIILLPEHHVSLRYRTVSLLNPSSHCH